MPQKRRSAAKGPVTRPVSAKVVVTGSEATPFFYCNFASVSHTKYDFILSFARIPSTLSETQKDAVQEDGNLPVEASVQVAISPGLLPEIMGAFDEQKRKYEERFGKIRSDSNGA